jgi:hypothetical protein
VRTLGINRGRDRAATGAFRGAGEISAFETENSPLIKEVCVGENCWS